DGKNRNRCWRQTHGRYCKPNVACGGYSGCCSSISCIGRWYCTFCYFNLPGLRGAVGTRVASATCPVCVDGVGGNCAIAAVVDTRNVDRLLICIDGHSSTQGGWPTTITIIYIVPVCIRTGS